MKTPTAWALRLLAIAGAVLLSGCERPPIDTTQWGFRGTGMDTVSNPRLVALQADNNVVPPALPAAPEGGPSAEEAFKNVQVLGDLSAGEFTRTMLAMTTWVAPQQGCNYCHAPGEDLSSDKLYTKVVARKMLQMTRHINADWTTHVAATGVTCYTCHRGQPVPAKVWFTDPGPRRAGGASADSAGQNLAAPQVGLSSLPYDPLTPYLLKDSPIRVISTTALPAGSERNIKQTEVTYGLMTHISQSLGVNCTYCHNSRSFSEWNQSPPQRVTAFHGIRMARDLNNAYLQTLAGVFPATRLGPTGDVAKVSCATCHQGVFKPLNGVPMAPDYPAMGLGAAKKTAAAAPAAANDATPAAAAPTGLLGKILFDTGKSDLTDEAQKVIADAAAALKGNADIKVALSGFADKRGNADKNAELAKQRAFAVRDALKGGGVAEDRIVLKKPEFVIGTADAESRRVEINVAN